MALEILTSPSAAPGLKSVARAALLSAIDHEIDVPLGTHLAVWHHLLGNDANAAAMHHHQLVHPDVGRDAIRVLTEADSGEAAKDLALAVLQGPNVAQVCDEDVELLADRVLDERRVRRILWLVEQVHELRGLAPEFIVRLRRRLATSPDAGVRMGAAELGALLPRLDEDFAREMLFDTSPIVRAETARCLEGVAEPDQDAALRLLRERMGQENHRTALSAIFSAVGALVRAAGRRPPGAAGPREH
jgi:hypothetical protein